MINQNNANYLATEQSNATEITNTHMYLPVEIWETIIEYCDAETTLSLTKTCKLAETIITPLLERKIIQSNYQQKVSNSCLSYSISAYKNFISGILENIDINTKIKIDEYFQQNKNNRNINKMFPAFVFQQLDRIAEKIEHAKGLTVELMQNIEYFILNPQSNHCAIIKQNSTNIINIYQISFPLELKILHTINLSEEPQYIILMQFTPQNNLLVSIANSSDINLILFKLNLDIDNSIQKTTQLWKYKIQYNGYLRDNSYLLNVIIYPNSDDKKLLLIMGKFSDPGTQIMLLEIKNFEFTIKNFVLCSNNPFPYNSIDNCIFSGNSLELAMIDCASSVYKIHLFSRNNTEDQFIEKSLPKIAYRSIPFNFDNNIYYKNVQFNKSGSICVFLMGKNAKKVVMLNKIDGEWHYAMILLDSWHECFGLTLDEKNLFLIRSYKDTRSDDFKKSLVVMPIEDRIIKSVPAPCYIRKHSDKQTIKYKTFNYLEKNTNDHAFIIHPSGLAVFSYNRYEHRLKATIPQKLKTIYYTKKIRQ